MKNEPSFFYNPDPPATLLCPRPIGCYAKFIKPTDCKPVGRVVLSKYPKLTFVLTFTVASCTAKPLLEKKRPTTNLTGHRRFVKKDKNRSKNPVPSCLLSRVPSHSSCSTSHLGSRKQRAVCDRVNIHSSRFFGAYSAFLM